MMDVLRYTPVTDQDFGTLSCWGVNEVGVQQNPCLFQVVLAGEWDTWVASGRMTRRGSFLILLLIILRNPLNGCPCVDLWI